MDPTDTERTGSDGGLEAATTVRPSPADGPHAAPSRRTLLLHRLVIAGLLLVLAVLGLRLYPLRRMVLPDRGDGGAQAGASGLSPAPPGIVVYDLAEHLARIEQALAHQSDVSETFFESATATVHMHVIGFEQSAPLHIHRRSHEVTAIVSGSPEVLQIHGRNGKHHRREGTYRPGVLVYSPPFCGHKWVNPAKDRMQGNLVFASPRFDGNLYVEQDDARLIQGGEPVIYEPDAELSVFLAGSLPYESKRLPMMDGKMTGLLIREHMRLDAVSGPSVIYVARGACTMEAGEEYALHEQHLLVLPPHTAVVFRAGHGTPVSMIVFRTVTGDANTRKNEGGK